MTTIVAGKDANFTVLVRTDGEPVKVTGEPSARVVSLDGKTELIGSQAMSGSEDGADYDNGLVAVALPSSETDGLPQGDALLVLSGNFGVRRYRLVVEDDTIHQRNSLFIKDLVVDELRDDRLLLAMESIMPDVPLSDSYLWDKIRAAESSIAGTLRVPLVPTKFFPLDPTQEQIDSLDGMPWAIDPGYDYDPSMFRFERWGYFLTRHKPIIDIEQMKFAYPAQSDDFFEIPHDWLRPDKKYGHVRIVPSSMAIFTTMNAFIMTALAGNRSIPFMIQLTYTAGLENAERDYPELIDVVKKMAVLKIVNDLYLPQSGSISADGLSQSLSVDASKYEESIDTIINGPPGSNGGLMTKIHGIRAMVV